MLVMCPLVHNYSVITLDNWYLVYCGPTRSNDYKTVDCECLFILYYTILYFYFSIKQTYQCL